MIVEPKNENGKKVVKAEFKIEEHCTPINNEGNEGVEDSTEPGGQATSGTPLETKNEPTKSQTVIIIGCSILGTILVVVLAALTIWTCFKRFRDKKMMKQDINDTYDRAGVDYEYDTTGQDYDFDTTGDDVSHRRKAVKMEVVDRNSVYGKTEEDWEGAVAVDRNPVYGN